MNSAHETPVPSPHATLSRIARAAWPTIGHTIGLIVIALIAYGAWCGYQNPDLLLDLAALRLC